MKKRNLTIFLILSTIVSLFAVTPVTAANEDLWLPKSLWSKYGNSTAVYSKDYDTKYKGDFSLKIQNLDYENNCFSKTIPAEKNTVYKISAMVKYESYELQPSDTGVGGANICIADEWTVSEIHNESEWKRIELEFNSGNRTSVNIYLRNGFYSGACKGTAWFSDVKIEKKDITQTTKWNFLCLIIKNVDVNVNFNKNSQYHYQNSFTQADVNEITSVLKKVPKSFSNISGNLMSIADLDIIPIDETVTNITGKYGNGYCINPEDIKELLDIYLAKKTYQQIIVVMPLGELAIGWYGLGGNFYENVGFAQVTPTPGEKVGLPVFPDAIFVHETLHCIENRAINMKKTAKLHDAEEYGYNGDNEWIEWYTDYMQDKLPDGKGLPKEVYNVYNNAKYMTISTNMNTYIEDAIVIDVPADKNSNDKLAVAAPTASTVFVNGKNISFDAYNINGNNYFKLRDLAAVINGTRKQFEVNYDNATKAITLTSGKSYTSVGGEMTEGDGKEKTTVPTSSKIYLDGKELSLTVYNIGGNNFFKLRDLLKAIDVYVGYDDATKAITVDTSRGYIDG